METEEVAMSSMKDKDESIELRSIKKIFSENFRIILQAHQNMHIKTKTDVCKILNISRAILNNYEKGKNLPSSNKLGEICKFFQVSPEEFFIDHKRTNKEKKSIPKDHTDDKDFLNLYELSMKERQRLTKKYNLELIPTQKEIQEETTILRMEVISAMYLLQKYRGKRVLYKKN